MHGARIPDDEPMSEMNFIPLIDIALTLVIILMVTTAFIKLPGVALKLPETVTREGTPETNRDLTILVAADGRLFVDASPRTLDEMKGELKALARRSKESRVLVKGDRGVSYGRVMEVMDVVRQAGLTRVVLPTDPKLPGVPGP
jgi:biopolymer transport protein TolR